MSSSRRERILKAGRLRFILLYGVCGWGLLFGLAFILPFGLPAFFLLRWFGGHLDAFGILSGIILPMLLSAIGGSQWGNRAWKGLIESTFHPNA